MRHSILTRVTTLIALAVIVAACSTNKENALAYFRNLPPEVTGKINAAESTPMRLAPDDEVTVTISSASPEATAMFNAPLQNPASYGDNQAQGSPKVLTHIVDADGNIELPVIGRVNIGGKTLDEAESLIRTQVGKTVRDPYVKVRMVGFYVDVLGEVKEPKRIRVDKTQYSVLDALAACGDLTEFARRDGVTLIRHEQGTTTYHRLNLADYNLFAQPCFYLHQDDVIYVEPNNIRIDNSKYNQNNAYKLSVISTVVSAVSVVASLVIALTR